MSSLTIGLFIAAVFCFVMALVCLRKGNQLGYFWTTLCVVLILFGGGAISDERAQRKFFELGEYWLSHCQLRVVNIDNGLFQDKTNQLDCEGVITYVPTQDYKEAVEAYQNSNVQMNTSTTDK